jgi:hypothetical protein
MPRLAEIEAHCAVVHGLAIPNRLLAEESLAGYVLLLSGHFQGFCRDLYTECCQVVTAGIPTALQATVQLQFSAELKLNSNNPTIETIRKDFERFAVILDFQNDPLNAPRVTHLGHLNKWRNNVAHKKATSPVGIPALTLAAVHDWSRSCDGLATWLDAIMYRELQQILGVTPW